MSFFSRLRAAIFVANQATMSIKQRFVQSILEDEGRRLMRNQSLALERKLQFHTNRLFNTRRTSVSGGADLDGRLTFTHTSYERFLDIKRLRYGAKLVGRHRKIHNRFVFGHYSSIASRLMYDLTDDVVAKIREEIKAEQ